MRGLFERPLFGVELLFSSPRLPPRLRPSRPAPAWNFRSLQRCLRQQPRNGNGAATGALPLTGPTKLLPGTLWASTFSQWFFRFLARTVPASSFPPPAFEKLSRDLGLFLVRRSHQGMLGARSLPNFSADPAEYTCRSAPWIGGPCSPGGDAADYPGCALRWLLRGGAGPGPAGSAAWCRGLLS